MKNKLYILHVVLAIVAGSDASEPVHAAEADSTRKAASALYPRTKQAAVEILVAGRLSGSGCIADQSGIVLTAAHVLRSPSKEIAVRLLTGGTVSADVLAIDMGHDLALLRLPARDAAYPFLPLAKKTPRAGRDVFLFGAPVFRHGVLLKGSVARRDVDFEYIGHFVEAMLVSGPSPRGTSGGPWVDRRGRIVGVQSSYIDEGQGSTGVTIVAPLSAVRRLLTNRKTARTPTMHAAVEELWGQDQKRIREFPDNLRGLVVRQLKPEGVAGKAGLKEWNIITAVDGQPVDLVRDFLLIMRGKLPGQKIRLDFLDEKGANPQQADVTLAHLESAWTTAEKEDDDGAK